MTEANITHFPTKLTPTITVEIVTRPIEGGFRTTVNPSPTGDQIHVKCTASSAKLVRLAFDLHAFGGSAADDAWFVAEFVRDAIHRKAEEGRKLVAA